MTPVTQEALGARASTGYIAQMRHDWTENRLAVVGELVGTFAGIAGAVTLAATAGSAPMGVLFPLWILGSIAGLLANLMRRNAVLIGQAAFHTCMNGYGFFAFLSKAGLLGGDWARHVETMRVALRAVLTTLS
jgi:hypothetical protein